ncbi:cyclodeaminase/cyclohydrolase family protein [Deinococcus fonticola]|uniref:cyclodeaminase/cyclohydrolase family protein n=1 Tax=Deinococcus fonticola TaxID=2528713 RepID=UPI001075684B|nr:cyclodeaminase/cyclohydrolase family protein [Deinococcus fonticola]
MTSLWNQPAADLLRAASSHQATPGGAGTAALSAAFGTALVHMAAVITLQKNRKADQEPGEWPRRMAELHTLMLRLHDLADQDVEVFGEFVAATRLPRATPAEQDAREEALSTAGDEARHTPLAIARTALAALQLAEELLPGTHAEVTSDVGAGAALLRGAVDAALLTLDINLRRLTPGERQPLQEQRAELTAQAHAAAERVLQAAQARIAADNA